MSINKGEILHKCVYERPKVVLFFFGLFSFGFLFGSTLILSGIINQLLEVSISDVFFGFFFAFIMIGLGVFILMGLLSYLVNYLVIFENGILIRRSGMFNFLKRRYISFDLIFDVEISDKHTSPDDWLVVYIKDDLPHVLDTEWITKRKKILNLIKKNAKATGEKDKLIFLTKMKYHGRGLTTRQLIPVRCSGSGSESDPFIIEENQYIPKKLHIYNYNLSILVNHLNIKELHLQDCKNTVIKGLNLKHMSVSNCSNFKLKDLVILGKFKMYSCKNIIIKNKDLDLRRVRFQHCSDLKIEDYAFLKKLKMNYSKNCESIRNDIAKLELYRSNNNHFKNNRIIKLKEKASKSNIYEECQIEHLESSIKRGAFNSRNTIINSEFNVPFDSLKRKKSLIERKFVLIILVIIIPIILGIIVGTILS